LNLEMPKRRGEQREFPKGAKEPSDVVYIKIDFAKAG